MWTCPKVGGINLIYWFPLYVTPELYGLIFTYYYFCLLIFHNQQFYLLLYNKCVCFLNYKIEDFRFSFFFLLPLLGPSELEMNMGGPQYNQQQAPPNQTAPWPESILPIDQASFASQNRWVWVSGALGRALAYGSRVLLVVSRPAYGWIPSEWTVLTKLLFLQTKSFARQGKEDAKINMTGHAFIHLTTYLGEKYVCAKCNWAVVHTV